MSSTKTLAKLEIGAAQPRISAAAAGDGQVASVTKAGEVLLKKPQQANYDGRSVLIVYVKNFIVIRVEHIPLSASGLAPEESAGSKLVTDAPSS